MKKYWIAKKENELPRVARYYTTLSDYGFTAKNGWKTENNKPRPKEEHVYLTIPSRA